MSEGTRLSLRRPLAARAADAFQVVYDVERFPEFMRNVESVTVLESSPTRRLVEWRMSIDDAPLDWTEEILYDRAGLEARFRAVEGVFERFDGHWRVTPSEAGSEVEVLLDYDLGVPEIEHIIGPVLRIRLRENLESMLNGIETRTLRR